MKSILDFKPEIISKELPKETVRVIGIDLGTTNSTAVEIIWDPQNPDTYQLDCLDIEQPTLEGTFTSVFLPSIVALFNGKELVGEGAKRLRARASEYGLEQNKQIFYECKNDMGLRRTYHRACEGYRSAPEIGSRVLSFLKDAIKKSNGDNISRHVISVPASFQIAQRQDTLLAATLADINVLPGDLLDEPVAAFYDYLMQFGDDIISTLNKEKNLLIFDFGGGTCDVAILKISRNAQLIKISPLAVSRYHRLGGSDIDRAILYECLVTQLRNQNALSEFELSYEDKKKIIEPAFLGLAEALKIGLCIEMSRLKKFNSYKPEEKDLIKTQPGMHHCNLKNKKLTLQSPKLSAIEFEKILEPFLDTDLIFARDTEYRLTCSIFAPLEDALERSGLDSKEIDFCLMVGGSSLIPQVQEAMAKYFTTAKMLTYSDRDSLQLAVGRGAAIHALALELYGHGITKSICNSSISIRTGDKGLVELVPRGVELPFPASGEFAKYTELAFPETNKTGTIPLKVEFVAGNDEYIIDSKIWDITEPVKRGNPLYLKYRLDENNVFHTNLSMLTSDGYQEFKSTIEHPLTHVVNPETNRLTIENLEELLKTQKFTSDQTAAYLVELAELYSEIRHHEKAIDFLKKALQIINSPDVMILNKLGIICGEIGDYEREEKYYNSATEADDNYSGALFNLALSKNRRSMYTDALKKIDEALNRKNSGPYNILRALILKNLGRNTESDDTLKTGIKMFDDFRVQSDWELGWYTTGLKLTGNEKKIKEIENELKARKKSSRVLTDEDGLLPITIKEQQ